METTSQQIIKKIDYNHTNPLGLDEIKNSDIIETTNHKNYCIYIM